MAVLTNARRTRDPLRRCLRSGRARAADAVAVDERGVDRASFLREASLANPIDMLGSATAATYESVLPHVLDDPNVDAVIVLFVPPVVATADDVAAAVVQGAVERREEAEESRCLAAFVSAGGPPPPASARARCRVRLSRVGGARARAGSGACRPGSVGRQGRHPGARRHRAEHAATDVIRETLEGIDASAWLEPAAACGTCSTPTASRRPGELVCTRAPTRRPLRQPSSVIRSRSRRAVPGTHKSDEKLLALDLALTRRSTSEQGGRAESVTPVVVRASDPARREPSCSPASCRIRSSARWSDAVRAASWPS